jgi:flagellar hook-associated protein 3 FlgL
MLAYADEMENYLNNPDVKAAITEAGGNPATELATLQTYQADVTALVSGDAEPTPFAIATAITPVRKPYSNADQNIHYEFGVGTKIPVNSVADDVFSAKLYADLVSFCDTVLNTRTSDPKVVMDKLREEFPNDTEEQLQTKANQQIAKEEQKIQDTLQRKFSNMLGILEDHSSEISKNQTDLGSRMARLDLIQNRLEADETAYSELKSENEDVDMVEVAMLLKNAEGVYQASLQVGMNMIQTSLVNFL